MLPLLVASKHDPAGSNMVGHMIDKYGFREKEADLYTNEVAMMFFGEEEAVAMEWLDDRFLPNYYIFLSRHRSENGIPTLTCHTTGNFSGSNEMGGRPKELGSVYPSLQKHYVKTIFRKMSEVPNYQVVIEATHHGPTSLKKPILFIEIGSSEKQWHDKKAVSVVCDSIVEAIKSLVKYEKVGIGLGGTHYPAKFTDMLINTEYALASVASKHSLGDVDRPMIEQMLKKSVEDVKYCFMDWKGLGREKERLNHIVTDLGLEVVKL